jgi:hypothetical protein
VLQALSSAGSTIQARSVRDTSATKRDCHVLNRPGSLARSESVTLRR